VTTGGGTATGWMHDAGAMRIVIADDSVLLREGLRLLLTEAGHEVVAQVADGPGSWRP